MRKTSCQSYSFFCGFVVASLLLGVVGGDDKIMLVGGPLYAGFPMAVQLWKQVCELSCAYRLRSVDT